MATNSKGSVARDYNKQLVHYLRKTVSFTDDGTEVVVGWVPAGALILKPISGAHVVTAFNAGTSNTLDIGGNTGNDDPDNFMDGNAIGTAGAFVPVDEAGGVYRATADTEITATVTLAGAAATAGEAEVIIAYIPDNDG